MNYLDTYNIWKSKHLEDPDLIAEMVDIEGNDHEIKERFVKMLEFGTAGLRGILGVGTNRMNIYTVALATQGMADYVKEKFENPSVIHLTIDCGYENGITGTFLDVLAEKGVKAVFFVTRPYAEANPELLRRMLDEGHELGNHSSRHRTLPELSPEEAAFEITDTEEYLKEQFGCETPAIF